MASRIGILWPFKAVGTMLFMGLFFWGYFAVLRDPLFPTTIMPLIGLDEWVPFTPLAFPAYVSLWVYASLAPALLANFRALAIFGVWMAGLCLSSLVIFWLFPTAVPAAGIDWSLYPQMAIIKDADASGNACPSLHVAAAVFSAFWIERVLRVIGAPLVLRGLSGLFCLMILWSTVATRQHVVLDVLAGTMIGTLFAVFSLRHALTATGAGEI
jgi:membrane-associated phospholipid phosphatase